MMDPHKIRELVLLLLYSFEITEGEESDLINLLKEECKVSSGFVEAALEKAQSVVASLPQIDEMLKKVSHGYSIERIFSIERNILRLGLFELKIEKKLPEKVIIAEAKRLAKKFSTSEAASFVQALLIASIHLE